MSFNKLSDQTMYTQIMRIHSFLFLDYCLLAVSQLLIKFQQTYYFYRIQTQEETIFKKKSNGIKQKRIKNDRILVFLLS